MDKTWPVISGLVRPPSRPESKVATEYDFLWGIPDLQGLAVSD
jgi:hypothetical protein